MKEQDLRRRRQRDVYLHAGRAAGDADVGAGNHYAYGYHPYAEYDAENRLRVVTSRPPYTGASRKVQFTYDYLGRRVRKEVRQYVGGSTWVLIGDRRYVYDGGNLLLELNGLNDNAVLYKYTWGLDLAGQNGGAAASSMGGESPPGLHGAGGVGGLLAMYDTRGNTNPNDDRQLVYFHDANGNVGQLIDSDPGSQYFGTMQARYEYYPFGGMLVSWGPYASNPFKFSDKYRDDETSLYNFGLRDHMPRLGRFLERDPIEEQGGLNLYAFVGNSPVNAVDPDGRFVVVLGGLWGIGDDGTLLKPGGVRKLATALMKTELEWYLANQPCTSFWHTKQTDKRRDRWTIVGRFIHHPRGAGGMDMLISIVQDYVKYREDIKRRQEEGECICPEYLHIVGFSDGASVLAEWLNDRAPGHSFDIELGLMGIIDMVRVKDEDFFHVNTDANRVHHVDTPVGLSHRYFRQTKGRWRGMKIEGGLGWKGDGVNDVAHEELPGDDRTITFFKNSLIGALEGLQVTEACDCPEQK